MFKPFRPHVTVLVLCLATLAGCRSSTGAKPSASDPAPATPGTLVITVVDEENIFVDGWRVKPLHLQEMVKQRNITAALIQGSGNYSDYEAAREVRKVLEAAGVADITIGSGAPQTSR